MRKLKLHSVQAAMVVLLLLSAFAFNKAHAVTNSRTPIDPNYAAKTYSVALANFTPAALATDALVITGSPTKVVRINYVQITADATGVGIFDFYLIKRTAANTGGTASNIVPTQHDSIYPPAATVTNSGFVVGQSYVISGTSTACNTIGASNNTIGTNFVATATSAASCVALTSATAQVKSYSANATTLGYGTTFRSDHYALPAVGTTGYPGVPWVEEFGKRSEQQIVLRGVNESFVVNFNGQTVPAGFVSHICVTWTEE